MRRTIPVKRRAGFKVDPNRPAPVRKLTFEERRQVNLATPTHPLTQIAKHRGTLMMRMKQQDYRCDRCGRVAGLLVELANDLICVSCRDA